MDKRIEYIARVFADAAGAEERENDVQFWAAELDGVVFLAFQTKYRRVAVKSTYRLKANFKKNFGNPIVIADMGTRFKMSSADDDSSYMLSLQKEGTVNWVNRVIWMGDSPFGMLEIDAVGLDDSEEGNQRETVPSAKYINPDFFSRGRAMYCGFHELLLSRTYFPSINGTWEDYCKAYQKLYDKLPPAVAQLQVLT